MPRGSSPSVIRQNGEWLISCFSSISLSHSLSLSLSRLPAGQEAAAGEGREDTDKGQGRGGEEGQASGERRQGQEEGELYYHLAFPIIRKPVARLSESYIVLSYVCVIVSVCLVCCVEGNFEGGNFEKAFSVQYPILSPPSLSLSLACSVSLCRSGPREK